jgi:hypothetical protein
MTAGSYTPGSPRRMPDRHGGIKIFYCCGIDIKVHDGGQVVGWEKP